MPKLPWTPWHRVVALRDDVKTGELSLRLFAADLYEVKARKTPKVHQRSERVLYEERRRPFVVGFVYGSGNEGWAAAAPVVSG